MARIKSPPSSALDDVVPAPDTIFASAIEALPPAATPPPTIQDVCACACAYLLAAYVESPTDQEAVYDVQRRLADGHLAAAWRQLVRMVEGVLSLPPVG